MKPEIHIFIVWGNASQFFSRIIDDITHHVIIKKVLSVTWDPNLFSENLTRFYGQNLPAGCDKEIHVGNAPFHLIIVEDTKPTYAQRDTTKGNVSVNTNIFDLKQKYRLMTGGGHKIHATNNPVESKHDIWLLLGEDSNKFSQVSNWDGKISETKKDLIGANGWRSMADLFNTLNCLVTYVVLRNFECLPDVHHMDTHGDIDLLVESLEEIIFITNAEKVFPEDNRVHFYIKINHVNVPFDFRYVGDNYYDVNFQLNILNDRKFADGGYFKPSNENYFYSLLYHALIHKPKLTEEYAGRISKLSSEIGIDFKCQESNGARLLAAFMYQHDYEFVQPIDSSVHYRDDIASSFALPSPKVPTSIQSIVDNAIDIRVLSTELRQHCTDWPSLYHLSGMRANIIRPFGNILKGDVLEIGAGCGAITRYLGECGANVLALEGSPHRAAIARSRTRDLDNVTVLAEKFDQFQCDHQFDVITLIGVLEYANLFTCGENPPLSMLKRVRALLKPDGKLIIAVENQLGLKYFAGAPEGHLGQPMYGIEGRYRVDQPQTFGRKVLKDMLKQAAFAASEFLTPFPDYKFPVSIIMEEGYSNRKFDAAAFAWQSARRDPQLPLFSNFSLELVWLPVFENHLARDLANSFLVVASPQVQTLVDEGVLAYHYSTDRRPEFCKETVFKRDEAGEVYIKYNRLVSIENGQTNNPHIQFVCPDLDKYSLGKPLSLELIQTVTRDGWSIDEAALFIKRYLRVLGNICHEHDPKINFNSPYAEVPGEYFDAVPQNIIIGKDGSVSLIDKEWQLACPIEVGHLLFRSLLLLLNSITRFGRPVSQTAMTRYQFIDGVVAAAGLKVQEEDYIRYIKLEASIQESLTCRSAENFVDWAKDQPIPILNMNQAMTECEGQIANLNQVVAERDALVNQIKNSSSWRITRPLRFFARLARHGLTNQDRLRLTQGLSHQYHRLPLPAPAKRLLSITYHKVIGKVIRALH
jgi:2-polyprenyl-3-methyl-5-hydroxy-6-metoxy-1,4-benzoquinol methylase